MVSFPSWAGICGTTLVLLLLIVLIYSTAFLTFAGIAILLLLVFIGLFLFGEWLKGWAKNGGRSFRRKRSGDS